MNLRRAAEPALSHSFRRAARPKVHRPEGNLSRRMRRGWCGRTTMSGPNNPAILRSGPEFLISCYIPRYAWSEGAARGPFGTGVITTRNRRQVTPARIGVFCGGPSMVSLRMRQREATAFGAPSESFCRHLNGVFSVNSTQQEQPRAGKLFDSTLDSVHTFEIF